MDELMDNIVCGDNSLAYCGGCAVGRSETVFKMDVADKREEMGEGVQNILAAEDVIARVENMTQMG